MTLNPPPGHQPDDPDGGAPPPAFDAPPGRPRVFGAPPPRDGGAQAPGQRWPGPAPAEREPTAATPAGTAATAGAPGSDAPEEAPVKGRIHIADEVVEKVAGLAAMEVEGVADLGGDFERAMESVRERIGIGNKRADQGIKADVKDQQVTIGVTIEVEFGHVVLDVARRVQANVARQTRRLLGLDVVEVNVTVDDVRTVREDPEGSTQPTVTAGA
ncbi:MAG TPA: Asp23/Gls24 family envelope stress response protein [Acidimicrobiales bacterium]|nr:Asp23/Gls24 family envelope stress response protein [Acidimicrobiales bacterium]